MDLITDSKDERLETNVYLSIIASNEWAVTLNSLRAALLRAEEAEARVCGMRSAIEKDLHSGGHEEDGAEGMNIYFGVMVDPLAKQLKGSGIPPATVEHLQLDANAIVRLSVRGLLQEGEVHKARKRLMKQIDAALSVPRP